MIDLLDAASLVAISPFVAQDQITTLQGARREVKRLPPSLMDEMPRVHASVTNNGSGSQFYHGGRGHMNHCSGGLQVTGDNQGARYSYGSMEQDRGLM